MKLWASAKESFRDSSNWLFIICVLYTIAFMAMNTIHFFGLLVFDPSFSTDFYLPLISLYAGDKEIKRWKGKTFVINRPGELMVYLIWLLPLAFYLINFVSGSSHEIPPRLGVITSSTLAIFVATGISKELHEKKKNCPDK